MALTADEQKFYEFAKASLPDWIPDGDEFLMGAAKMFGGVKALIDYLFGQALIGSAIGATSTTPDWLNQHARDRGTTRVDGEDDPTLRERLRFTPDALTRLSILTAINAALEAEGVTDDAAIVELPKHGAHGGSYSTMTGTGGTFAVTGTTVKFTPAVLPWPRPPFYAPTLVPLRTTSLIIGSAANAANNGTHDPIEGLDGNAAIYTDASAVAGVDPTCTWEVATRNPEGFIVDEFARAYSQRGYRSARVVPLRIVVILPYGSTEATEIGVREALRQKKAAGIAVTVERRLIAP